jgi:hypothetical protein
LKKIWTLKREVQNLFSSVKEEAVEVATEEEAMVVGMVDVEEALVVDMEEEEVMDMESAVLILRSQRKSLKKIWTLKREVQNLFSSVKEEAVEVATEEEAMVVGMVDVEEALVVDMEEEEVMDTASEALKIPNMKSLLKTNPF